MCKAQNMLHYVSSHRLWEKPFSNPYNRPSAQAHCGTTAILYTVHDAVLGHLGFWGEWTLFNAFYDITRMQTGQIWAHMVQTRYVAIKRGPASFLGKSL